MTSETLPPKKVRGGRPKGDPAAVRRTTIGVRVSTAESAALKTKAEAMGLTPAEWLRQAALSRRLPPPPAPAINRAEYADLARLAGNLNQLARLAHQGGPVSVDSELLLRLADEVAGLRLALLSVKREDGP